jgi:hypothetical protein
MARGRVDGSVRSIPQGILNGGSRCFEAALGRRGTGEEEDGTQEKRAGESGKTEKTEANGEAIGDKAKRSGEERLGDAQSESSGEGDQMKWFWYVGRENELLLDWDSDTAMWFGLERIARNVRRGLLHVSDFAWGQSAASGHYHAMVTLETQMAPIERAMWEVELRSDVKRAQYSVMRSCHGLSAADLLIAKRAYPGFREPDYTCNCDCMKHKKKKITGRCPVMRELLGGEATAEYFAAKKQRKTLRLPVGRVPVALLLNS